GVIDFDDYSLIDNNFNNRPRGLTAVPEPTTIVLIGLSLFLRRRRARYRA
ncbi:MAG: PEP-CTERM sorting domain-containing protein, partial [Anaerolineae bacterium]|nr:PEP-CTERM sorting domain-containing protein [Phycisphaerae bacterium]